jgi:hypothetical protein
MYRYLKNKYLHTFMIANVRTVVNILEMRRDRGGRDRGERGG